MELYLIRHAQSTNNANMLIDERDRESDPALTDLGHEQSRRLAEHLRQGYNPDGIVDRLIRGDLTARAVRGFQFDRLVCSPMYRSLQTTRYIAEATGLTPEVWVGVHEHGGLYIEHDDERGIVGYPGKSRAEIMAEFPGFTLTDDITDSGWWTGAREDYGVALGRAMTIAEQLRRQATEAPDERIAIVSHGTFLSALLKAIFNQLPGRSVRYHHHNTGMTRVDISPTGHMALRFLNRVDHLTSELIT